MEEDQAGVRRRKGGICTCRNEQSFYQECWTVESPGESMEMELDCEAFTGEMILNPFCFNLVLWDAPYTREELEDAVQLLDEKGEPVRLPGSGSGGESSSGYVSVRRTGGTLMDVENIRQLKIGDQVFEL